MNALILSVTTHARRAGFCLAAAALLAACSSGPARVEPAPLPASAALIGVNPAWTAQVGPADAPLSPFVAGGRVFAASSSGTVVALDAGTGRDVWRVDLGSKLSAGVGSDGETAAVITRENQLVAIHQGRELWRVRLPARSFTPPLVAGKRVFVLTADRSVYAFDGSSGVRLWTQSRPGEPLVLGQAGVLLAVGDTLVAGLSARLTGLDPINGAVRWQAPVATSRGTNEVERLVDLVGTVSREGSSVCARAFGAAVGCVDTANGQTTWTKPANGATGVQGDERLIVGSESDGRVLAWQRATGERAWEVTRFKHRQLTSPLLAGRVVVFGESTGAVHLVSREDGSDMARLSTDGSGVLGAPVLAGQNLLVQTRKGMIYAWRPQ